MRIRTGSESRPNRFGPRIWLLILLLLAAATVSSVGLAYGRAEPLVLAGSDHCAVVGSRLPQQAQFVDCGRYYLFPSTVGASRLVDLCVECGERRTGQPPFPPELHQLGAHLGRRYLFAVWW